MTAEDILELFQRLARLVSATRRNAGEGTSWVYLIPSGAVQRVSLRGLRSHAEAQDSVETLLIWVWNAKDYLKKRATETGRPTTLIEDAVKADLGLRICADLANSSKHGGLDRPSRSQINPRLGKLSYEIPGPVLRSLTINVFETELDIGDASRVQVKMPVLNEQGIEMGDALEYAAGAITSLERLRDEIEERSGTSSETT